MSGSPPPARHLDALTGLRGIAAWMVVLYHIRFSLTGLFPAPVITGLGKGYLAVDLFFMLSGFVLWYNYADRLAQGGLPAVRQFLWRRFARIWPLHALIMVLFIGYALALWAKDKDIASYPFDQLPLHLLLAQNWGMTSELAWNHPAWSISTELAAYLVFPLFVSALQWSRVPLAALLAICAGLLGSVALLFAAHGLGSLGSDITGLGLWRCLLEFAAGCLLCMLWHHWRDLRLAAPLAGLTCLGALATGWLAQLPETTFMPLAFASGLMALALSRSFITRALGQGTLLYLGEISYSTYLAHFLLFIIYKHLLVDATLQLGWPGLLGFLGIVLAASMALYHMVEKPAQRWLNNHAPRRAAESKPVSIS